MGSPAQLRKLGFYFVTLALPLWERYRLYKGNTNTHGEQVPAVWKGVRKP